MISTAGVPAREQFDFWRELNGKLWVPYELRCDRPQESGFSAHVQVSEFGPVQATLMTTMPHTIRRTPRLIRQADPDVFKLGCVVQGGGLLAKDGQESVMGVGDLVLYDPSHPYDGQFASNVPGGNQLLLLRFPRASLPLPSRDLRRLSATPIPGDRGIGALSSQFLMQVGRRLTEFSPSDTARLSTLTLDVLTTALAAALDNESVIPPHTRRRALMARIHAFVRENLGDADLTPDAIAAAHHISLRYLHKLFQQEGKTVAGWIRNQRLEQCRRDLAEAQLGDQPIHAIANRWGFPNSAHFSQAFRNSYRSSPSQYRNRNTAAHAD
ncbi:helix-turn-helix domain-containing protein [Amycolatopsis sp. SID8362]|uniref:AraC-like ligand-binding domain-containing protein n=1 Tax=Amycolatopsis sp. SID8362 TaxID=2690346 RepID=UPI0028165F54|nr:helix-turn-helix domain-containing protein [Amycolatopsis sp. SID8362]